VELPQKEISSTWALFLQLSPAFWSFIVGASMLYGAMVPFWFIGAKYLHEAWGFSDVKAAALMSVPELMMVVVAIPWGWMTDAFKWSTRKRLLAAAASGFAVFSVGIIIFKIAFPEARWIAYLLLPAIGSGFAIACTTAWATVNRLNEPKLHSLGSSILGAAINLLPAIVPAFFKPDTAYNLTILAFLGAASALAFVSAALLGPREEENEKEMV